MNVLTIGGVKIEGLAACVPAHAVENEAQVRLGLPKDVVAFDVSLACSGWGYGLYLAGLQLEEGGTIQMDGFGVFKFVATDVVGYLREFLSANSQQLTANSFVPHQPNVYMVRQLAKSLGVAEGTTAISCDQLGNLSVVRFGAGDDRVEERARSGFLFGIRRRVVGVDWND